jgi:hypothetical protein
MSALEFTASMRQGNPRQGMVAEAIEVAVAGALRRGFRVGCRVGIGAVRGEIIGFNIAAFGSFVGKCFPLLVLTELGVTKCSIDELQLLADDKPVCA